MVIPHESEISGIKKDGRLNPDDYHHATILDIRGNGENATVVHALSFPELFVSS
jgi:hypothetical protein